MGSIIIDRERLLALNPVDFLVNIGTAMRTRVSTNMGYAELISLLENADSIMISDNSPKMTLKQASEVILKTDTELYEILDLTIEYVRRKRDLGT